MLMFKKTRLMMCAGLALFLLGCEDSKRVTFPTVDRPTAGIFLEPDQRVTLPEGVDLRAVYAKGLELTKLSEGFRKMLYNDAAGFCTIAYGHLVKRASCDGTEQDEFLMGVTKERGGELLVDDMRIAQITVMTSVEITLTDGQFAALCDFVYNVGSGNFRSSTLLKVLNARQLEQVPYQLRRWIKAGGRELAGLKERREREITLFFEGVPLTRTIMDEEEFVPIDILKGETEI